MDASDRIADRSGQRLHHETLFAPESVTEVACFTDSALDPESARGTDCCTVLQDGASNREAVSCLSFDVVSHHEMETSGR